MDIRTTWAYITLSLQAPKTDKSTLGAMLLLEPRVQFLESATYHRGVSGSGFGIDWWRFLINICASAGWNSSLPAVPWAPFWHEQLIRDTYSEDMLSIESGANVSFTLLANPSVQHVGISTYVEKRASHNVTRPYSPLSVGPRWRFGIAKPKWTDMPSRRWGPDIEKRDCVICYISLSYKDCSSGRVCRC